MTKKKLIKKAMERAKRVQNNHDTKPNYKEFENKQNALNHKIRIDRKRRLAAKSKEYNKNLQVNNEELEQEKLLKLTAVANSMSNN